MESQLTVRVLVDPPGIIEIPARPDPRIVIHVGRSVRVACDRGGRRHQGLSVHGDVDIIPAGIPVRWELKEEDMALVVGVPTDLLRNVAAEAGLDPASIEIVNRFQIRDPHIEHIGWALKAELESGFTNGNIYLQSLASALSVHLLNRHTSRPMEVKDVQGGMPGDRLRHLLAYIEDHLTENLSLEEIAEVTGLGASHCNNTFRASTGKSIPQYINARRVERARVLLSEEHKSVAEAAAATGFAHASHLAAQMRRLLGVSPRSIARGRYRRVHDAESPS